MKHTIDAQGKRLGRVASQAAAVLLGKNSASFAKNRVAHTTVEIINASKTDLTALKKNRDTRVTFTGFRGGLRTETLGDLMARRGMQEVYRRAILRMLPNNKLRAERMKNLKVSE